MVHITILYVCIALLLCQEGLPVVTMSQHPYFSPSIYLSLTYALFIHTFIYIPTHINIFIHTKIYPCSYGCSYITGECHSTMSSFLALMPQLFPGSCLRETPWSGRWSTAYKRSFRRCYRAGRWPWSYSGARLDDDLADCIFPSCNTGRASARVSLRPCSPVHCQESPRRKLLYR